MTVSANSSCAGLAPGSVAKTSDGALLSCQGGTWKSAMGGQGCYTNHARLGKLRWYPVGATDWNEYGASFGFGCAVNSCGADGHWYPVYAVDCSYSP